MPYPRADAMAVPPSTVASVQGHAHRVHSMGFVPWSPFFFLLEVIKFGGQKEPGKKGIKALEPDHAFLHSRQR